MLAAAVSWALMVRLLLADLNYVFELHGFVAGAALGVEELEQSLQSAGVGDVAEEGAVSFDADEILGFEFVEVMGQGGVGDFELLLNFADDQTLGMGGEQQLHDAQARLGSYGGKHVGVLGNLLGGFPGPGYFHISRIAEI